MPDTTETVTRVIVEQLGVESDAVKPDARFDDDLAADSLDMVEVVMALEEECGVEITDQDAETIATVGDAIALIDRLRAVPTTA